MCYVLRNLFIPRLYILGFQTCSFSAPSGSFVFYTTIGIGGSMIFFTSCSDCSLMPTILIFGLCLMKVFLFGVDLWLWTSDLPGAQSF